MKRKEAKNQRRNRQWHQEKIGPSRKRYELAFLRQPWESTGRPFPPRNGITERPPSRPWERAIPPGTEEASYSERRKLEAAAAEQHEASAPWSPFASEGRLEALAAAPSI